MWILSASMAKIYITKQNLLAMLPEKLSKAEPGPIGGRKACVALVFYSRNDDIELLLMRRSERDDDHWSGQIAFPGGGCEPADKTYCDTAIRETKEEMGFDLNQGSKFLGYLKQIKMGVKDIAVIPCVFLIDHEVFISPNAKEVSSYKWIPIQEFLIDGIDAVREVNLRGIKLSVPSFDYQGYRIWGLTYRIIKSIF